MEFLNAVLTFSDEQGYEDLKQEASARIKKKVEQRKRNNKTAVNDELDEAVLCVLTDEGSYMFSSDIVKGLAKNGITVNPKTGKKITGSTISACGTRLAEKGLIEKNWSGAKNETYRYKIIT